MMNTNDMIKGIVEVETPISEEMIRVAISKAQTLMYEFMITEEISSKDDFAGKMPEESCILIDLFIEAFDKCNDAPSDLLYYETIEEFLSDAKDNGSFENYVELLVWKSTVHKLVENEKRKILYSQMLMLFEESTSDEEFEQVIEEARDNNYLLSSIRGIEYEHVGSMAKIICSMNGFNLSNDEFLIMLTDNIERYLNFCEFDEIEVIRLDFVRCRIFSIIKNKMTNHTIKIIYPKVGDKIDNEEIVTYNYEQVSAYDKDDVKHYQHMILDHREMFTKWCSSLGIQDAVYMIEAGITGDHLLANAYLQASLIYAAQDIFYLGIPSMECYFEQVIDLIETYEKDGHMINPLWKEAAQNLLDLRRSLYY